MANEQQQPPVGRNVRPTLMISGGNGDTTFVDVRDLHPENETTAALGGAAAGAAIAAGIPALAMAIAEKDLTKHTNKFAMLAVAGAALGATIRYMDAQTHNKWSDRVTSKTLETQQGQQVG